MFSSRTLKSLVPIGVAFLSCSLVTCSQAQTVSSAPPVAATASPAAEARQFLQLMLVHDSCELPVSLKTQNVTTEEIAALVQKKLAASDREPAKWLHVEVRKVLPTRLSFNTKNSTVGGVLRSAAVLAGAKLWILPRLLLIAPESALTSDELVLAKKRAFVDLSEFGQGTSLSLEAQKAFIAFIKNEILGLPGSSVSASAKDDAVKWQTKVTFDQLSPDSQAMLQQLTQLINGLTPNLPLEQPMALSSGTTIGTTSTASKSLVISFPDSDIQPGKISISVLGWSDDGRIDPHSKFGARPPKVPATPFIDPSAGNS